MAEPLSIASGVAGIITLSSAVVAAGYKYFNSVRSAPEDLKILVREIGGLNTLISQLATHALARDSSSRPTLEALLDQDILQDCERTLVAVQNHLQSFELTNTSRRKNAIKILAWPLKREDLVKGREHISRLCALLITAINVDNASAIATIEQMQRRNTDNTQALVGASHDLEVQRILGWLSTFNPSVKHTATKLLQHPGTSEWLLQKQAVEDWVDRGNFLWLHGPSGCGKTVLVYVLHQQAHTSQVNQQCLART